MRAPGEALPGPRASARSPAVVTARRPLRVALLLPVLFATAAALAPAREELRAEAPPLPQVASSLPPPGEQARRLALLRSAPCELLSERRLGSGVTGARAVEVRCAGETIRAKWRPAPSGLDGWNNSPRKELAAWAAQDLALAPGDRVVPPTALRCVPLDAVRAVEPDAEPVPSGTGCVLGTLHLWIEHARPVERLYDPERFARDPGYARRVADLNLFAYLIDHRDGRRANFMAADDPDGRRLYSVDNGIAFGGWVWNWFVRNWNEIRVPALRRESVERLREASAADFDALAVVAELAREPDGVLRPVPPGAPRAPDEGVSWDGERLQLGLTRDEIAAMKARRRQLLEDVDAGRVRTF